MKRNHFLSSSIGSILLAGFLFGGCGDVLEPPIDNNGNQGNQTANPNKITLKGDLIIETPLPEDAKVVLVWGVSTGRDYGYVHGVGTIDRTNNTFEITLNDKPPLTAVNWFGPGQYDTGFGSAVIAVVPSSVIQDQISFNSDAVFDNFYGTVDYCNLIYFSADPDFWWQMDPEGCHDWTKAFDAGYEMGRGLPAADGCTFDGFTPISPTGLKLIINSDKDRFTFVNWT